MSEKFIPLKSSIKQKIDLVNYRYVAEGVLPLTDYISESNEVTKGLEYSVKGDTAIIDGFDTANFPRFFSEKKPCRLDLYFPDGGKLSGAIEGVKGTALTLTGVVQEKGYKPHNPEAVVYIVWEGV